MRLPAKRSVALGCAAFVWFSFSLNIFLEETVPPQREDSSEEDEEGENEYDLTDKFIAGEDEDDDDSPFEGQQNRRRRHKRRRLKTPELDEDDYQLLEDNQVTVRLCSHSAVLQSFAPSATACGLTQRAGTGCS